MADLLVFRVSKKTVSDPRSVDLESAKSYNCEPIPLFLWFLSTVKFSIWLSGIEILEIR